MLYETSSDPNIMSFSKVLAYIRSSNKIKFDLDILAKQPRSLTIESYSELGLLKTICWALSPLSA